jgi:hypothetical protein
MKDDIVKWSTNGIPHRTMGVLLGDKDPENCDIGQLLELFVRLTNVTKARIALSPSLKVHQALIRWGEDTEGSMMGLWNFDDNVWKSIMSFSKRTSRIASGSCRTLPEENLSLDFKKPMEKTRRCL